MKIDEVSIWRSLPEEIADWKIVSADPSNPNCVIFNIVAKRTTIPEKIELNFTIKNKEEIEFEF